MKLLLIFTLKVAILNHLKLDKKFFVSCQDEFPLMFAISCLLPGISVFKGIEDLANKESNRIKGNGKDFKTNWYKIYCFKR